jgi:hypothetical protein
MPKKSPTKPNMMRIYNRTVVERQQAMLLISRSAGVLANHIVNVTRAGDGLVLEKTMSNPV